MLFLEARFSSHRPANLAGRIESHKIKNWLRVVWVVRGIRVVQVVQVVRGIQVVQVVHVVNVVQVVMVVSLDDLHSEIILFTWSKPSDY